MIGIGIGINAIGIGDWNAMVYYLEYVVGTGVRMLAV